MFHVKQCKIRRKRGSKTRRGAPACVCRRRSCERACCGKKRALRCGLRRLCAQAKAAWREKTSGEAVLDRRGQGRTRQFFLRTCVAKWREDCGMAAKRYKRRLVTERCDGRFSYKWVDNGGDREKSAEKLTIENKFHVKQNFAARVSHET